ncbi:hypothetical protein FA95DRAFT_1538888 [Auriscalpium vulgare]|uniref:Uncharacterized protein n=1 Tax=Auriscalpium vulgare TaxID=40419 RepID=A0ACB8RYY7_9AGAM|nr:hypothetical protein FA95DRAFT_1538888 [Auriscalpium vulgare]
MSSRTSSSSSSAPRSPLGKATASPPSTTHNVLPSDLPHASSSDSSVKVSSPLNPRSHSQSPATTPIAHPGLLPTSSPPSSRTPRVRVHSFSAASGPNYAQPPDSALIPITRVSSNPLPHNNSSTSLSTLVFGAPSSTFRHRSPSTSRSRGASPVRGEVVLGSATPTSTWWSRRAHPPRPWDESPKKKKTIPAEQTEGYLDTRKRVAHAVGSVLGTAALAAHEVLFIGVDLLRLAPVPGLEIAGFMLLNIWDALEMVEMNRLASLRLTQRCADILIAVRQEIVDAGNAVSEELELPIQRLNKSFEQVWVFLQKQAHRPFLKRYLKRDEILRSLAFCDASLSDALGMFGMSIQIRTLKLLQANEERRQAETAAIVDAFDHHNALHNALEHNTHPAILPASPVSDNPDHVQDILRRLRSQQNAQDRARDFADLRQLMRAALQTNDDTAMIEVLQVGRSEMPEAIKTLQRALEREVEREWSDDEGDFFATVEEVDDEVPGKTQAGSLLWRPKGTSRSATVATSSAATEGSVSADTGSSDKSSRRRAADTLDREFLESGIDALRRLSQGTELMLPSWTITRFEVDLEVKIGIGFFSDVYKGTWRHHTVAIKVLAETTPHKLFVHEIGIWKQLSHPNVLELLGASSASGDAPWFLVSPYYSNGSLVTFLKGMTDQTAIDLLRMIHEISKGMAYLHEKGVLHGDLKAANVLVDDNLRCVISDFGQSEMRSEVYRISRTPIPHGTLRWQAPELMMGAEVLTPEIDVYAFAICCVEILTKGALPWPLMDDDAVRHLVINDNIRPSLPLTALSRTALGDIVHRCWDRNPQVRPSFEKIAQDIKRLRKELGTSPIESPRPPSILLQWDQQDQQHHRPSPDMHPVGLPSTSPKDDIVVGSSSTDATFRTAKSSLSPTGLELHTHDDVLAGAAVPGTPVRERSPSLNTITPDASISSARGSGFQSPPPPDDVAASYINERRYRLLLQHEYHTSLTLPLWSPIHVGLGDVGYLEKPDGSFKTLFNAFDPAKTSGGVADVLPMLTGFGKVTEGNLRQDKRNAAQRSLDLIQNLLYRSRDKPSPQTASRTQSFQLRAGHKVAYLYAETTMYRYLEDLAVPKKWFQANIDQIMKLYGRERQLTKEDVFFVIGTLDAPDYATFVSHSHPDGQVNFNIYNATKVGQTWGQFSFTAAAQPSASVLGGPIYHEEMVGNTVSADKVSRVKASGPWDTVLLARLRFKPDATEPTSL